MRFIYGCARGWPVKVRLLLYATLRRLSHVLQTTSTPVTAPVKTRFLDFGWSEPFDLFINLRNTCKPPQLPAKLVILGVLTLFFFCNNFNHCYKSPYGFNVALSLRNHRLTVIVH